MHLSAPHNEAHPSCALAADGHFEEMEVISQILTGCSTKHAENILMCVALMGIKQGYNAGGEFG